MRNDFPKIREAIEEYHAARLAAEAAHRELVAASRDWRLRSLAAAADEAMSASAHALREAYASDLLPVILGARWRPCQGSASPVWTAMRRRGFGDEYSRTFAGILIDHTHAFRRVGARGALTWENSVVLSEPYDAWDREHRTVTDGARAHAGVLGARLGLSVWTRPDLSGWFKGWTSLVLIARGLDPAGAAAVGFVALA